ncbi:hypothetical protein [Mariprofundus erugo]|uniref:hypothetical protein n=1 Tax=Mariprofundus erugo TaxID=2528639 RepID=UPI0014791E55|nr:hypothetical protein [Mariprofundus erugo]
MRLMLMLFMSLFFLASCSVTRTVMVTAMDVVTSPYKWYHDDETYDEKDDTIN